MDYAKEPPKRSSYVSVNTLTQPRNDQKFDGLGVNPPSAIKEQSVIQGKQDEGKGNTVGANQKDTEKAGSGLGDQAVSKGLTGAAWLIEKMPAVSFAPVPGFEFMQNFFKGMMVGSLERLSQEKVADLWQIIQNVAKAVTSTEYMKAYFWGFLRGFFGDFLMIWELPGTIKSTAQFMEGLVAKIKELSQEDLQGFIARINEIKALVVETGADSINTILKDIKAGKSSELIIEILKSLDNFSQDAGISVGSQLTGVMLAYFSKDRKELGKDLGGIMGELSGTVAFTALLAAITYGTGAVWGGVRAGIKTVTDIIGKGVGQAIKAIGTVCKTISGIFGKFIEGARTVIRGFGKGASKLFKGIKGKLDEVLVKVKGLIDDVLAKLGKKFLTTGKGLTSDTATSEKIGEAAEKKIPKGVLDETTGKTVKEVKGEVTENAEKLGAKGSGKVTRVGITGEGIPLERVKPNVLEQIHPDDNAAYGYLPNKGTAYSKAEFDFTDVEWAKNQRQIRIGYLEGSNELENKIKIMESQGLSKEEIAQQVVDARNQQKVLARQSNKPEERAILEARNIEKYRNPIGPTAEDLFEETRLRLIKNGSYLSDEQVWDAVIEKSMKKDDVINTLLGLEH